MLLEYLPGSLYENPKVEVILKGKNSSILFKSLSENLQDKKMYLSSTAVLLVVEGIQHIKNHDGMQLVVKKNEMVVLPKDLYVVSDFIAKSNCFKAYIFFIDDLIITDYLSTIKYSFVKNAKNDLLKIPANSQIGAFTKSLDATYRKLPSNKSLAEIKVLEFLFLLGLQKEAKKFVSLIVNPTKKRNIHTFMEKNYLSNLNVSDYALLTGRSLSTFNREFKRLYATTPKEWLISKRLSKSRELLNNTHLNVTEVSVEVGYENVSHFIAAYKKKYGVTPKTTLNLKLTEK